MKRMQWLDRRIKQHGWRIGVEVGTKKGNTSLYITRNNPKLRLLAVDLWEPQPNPLNDPDIARYNTWDHNLFLKQLKTKIRRYGLKGRLRLFKGSSIEAAAMLSDECLDFVFIDADHSFLGVYTDICTWFPKVKVGGFLTGHDIHYESVCAAVCELLPDFKVANADSVWFWRKDEGQELSG